MMSVSLDGFMEGPNRQIDWHLVDDELHRQFNDVLRDAGAFLDGRATWELMARIWGETPKIVFSRTLEHADWNTTIARNVDPADIARLKASTTGDLFLGGADLAATFLRRGLVDEHRIYLHPVLLGAGTAMYPAPPTPL